MKVPRWLQALGRRVRAPLWILWNLATAALGARVGHFADRRGTSPARRIMWRVLLTVVLLAKLAPIFCALVAGVVVLGVAAPPLLLCTYAWGNLREIWRG
jgi:hypothetical protein